MNYQLYIWRKYSRNGHQMLILPPRTQQVPIINDKNDLLGNTLVLKKITTKKWKPNNYNF